jgi:hypothetical protein
MTEWKARPFVSECPLAGTSPHEHHFGIYPTVPGRGAQVATDLDYGLLAGLGIRAVRALGSLAQARPYFVVAVKEKG